MPGGRGQGEPIRLMADIEEGAESSPSSPMRPARKFLIAANDGRGFIVGRTICCPRRARAGRC